MSWVGIGMGLARAAGWVGRFLKSLPWQVYAVIAALLLAWGAWHLHEKAVSAAYTQGYLAGSADTAKEFNDAQAAADEKARAKVAVTVTKQKKIAKEASHALYQKFDDIDARARALSLQHEQSPAARLCSIRPLDLPAAGGDAGEPEAPPPCDGLSWSVALPLLTQAAKDLAQLNAILDYEDAQDALAQKEAELANTPTE